MSFTRSLKLLLILATACLVYGTAKLCAQTAEPAAQLETTASGPSKKALSGIPDDPGFSTLSISVPNTISRSGQPTIAGFKWLKENGWRGVVNLRNFHNDADIKGFKELGFHYLALPIVEGLAPSDQQAQDFLKFVTDPQNQPVHVHCRGGIGRTGVMVALYRYAVQGWPVGKAIDESRLFNDGMTGVQKSWLEKWAQTHKPGSHGK